MCGIAGLIHKGKTSNIGSEMTSMLQALKHRGPDSTGFAIYGEPSSGEYIMRVKVAEKEDIEKGHGILDKIDARIKELEKRLSDHKAKVKEKRKVTEYALRYIISHDGDTEKMARYIEEITGAKLVCNNYGGPHYTMDFSDSFIEEVVENFVDEYISGRTPNPCVRCNSFVKWDAFLQKADELGADFIATGHYAQIFQENSEYTLHKGVAQKKDQSYQCLIQPIF